MRLRRKILIPLVIFLLFIGYQNFSSLNPNEWDSTNTLKIMHDMDQFNKNDHQAASLATPQSGSDFQSVRNDWVQRQGSIILNGYDKKLESMMNDKLNSWVHEITKKDSSEEGSTTGVSASGPASSANSSQPATSETKKSKQSLKFTRINSLKYELDEKSCFNFTADPGNAHLDYSQALSLNSKLGLEHRTSDNKTQMFWRYEW